jgi:hypothetical protein
MAYNNQNIFGKKSKDTITTKLGGKDEVKLSKEEAIELCKLARGIKKILESKIAKA